MGEHDIIVGYDPGSLPEGGQTTYTLQDSEGRRVAFANGMELAETFFGLRTSNAILKREKAQLQKESNEQGSALACCADLMNTWARESGVEECKSPWKGVALRELADRLWTHAAQKRVALEAELSVAVDANKELNDILRDTKAEVERLRGELEGKNHTRLDQLEADYARQQTELENLKARCGQLLYQNDRYDKMVDQLKARVNAMIERAPQESHHGRQSNVTDPAVAPGHGVHRESTSEGKAPG
jgi:uncharacterized coiled-coil protein SlyX